MNLSKQGFFGPFGRKSASPEPLKFCTFSTILHGSPWKREKTAKMGGYLGVKNHSNEGQNGVILQGFSWETIDLPLESL